MALNPRRDLSIKTGRTFLGGPDWFTEPYMSFFHQEVLNHLYHARLRGGWPNSHLFLNGIEVAVASTLGRVVIVADDINFLELLRLRINTCPFDTVLTALVVPQVGGVLFCAARGFESLPPYDGVWMAPAFEALAGNR